MEFAINYSHEAAALLTQGLIHLDRFKVPDWDHLVAEAAPIRQPYVHFPLVTGMGRLETVDWERVTALRDATTTPFVNVHLTLDAAEFPVANPAPEAQSRAIDRLLTELRPIIDRFGAANVMVENVPYYGGKADIAGFRLAQCCVEPAVINAVVDALGCGLLLDISHARISAAHLRVDAQTYIRALPTDRIREVHITGLGWHEDEWIDHFPIRPEDWGIIEWAFSHIHSGAWASPRIVAFEYGGVDLRPPLTSHRAAIAADVPRLYNLVHQFHTQPS